MKLFLAVLFSFVVVACDQGDDKKSSNSPANPQGGGENTPNFDSSRMAFRGFTYDHRNLETIKLKFAEAYLSYNPQDNKLNVEIVFAENKFKTPCQSEAIQTNKNRYVRFMSIAMEKGKLQKIIENAEYGTYPPTGSAVMFAYEGEAGAGSTLQEFGGGEVTVTNFTDDTVTVLLNRFVAGSFSASGQAIVKICK